LVGASGAGKSTLLQALAGLLDRIGAADEEGELRVRGDAGLVLQDPDTQLVMARSGDDVAFGLENRCVPTAEIWPPVPRAPADGPAHAVFAREGERLKRLGVWVPGAAPAAPPRRAAADAEAIVARDLSYLYPRGEGPALDGVSAAVRRGSALAITGPNGSGKS